MPFSLIHHPRVHLCLLPIFLSLSLLIGLLLSLSACQSVQGNADMLPHFITWIDLHDPRQMRGLGKSVLHPNGSLYVVNSASIGIITSTQLSQVIPIPLPSGKMADALKPHYPELWDLAVDMTTGKIYVTDITNHFIHVISGTNIITSFSSLGMFPDFITFDPHTGLGYISNFVFSRENPREKRIIVLSDTHVITQIIRSRGQSPTAQFYNPIDGKLYIGHHPGDPAFGEEPWGVITVISGTQILTTTFLGNPDLSGIFKIAVDQKTSAMYFLDMSNQLVYWHGDDIRHLVLWQAGFRVTRDLAVDSRTGWAYVTAWNDHPSQVAVVDKDKIIAAITVGEDPYAVAVDETHDYVYVANRLSGSLSVIRGTEVITTLSTMGSGPSYITVDEARGYIYVSNADSHSVAVFGFDQPPPQPLWRRFFPFIGR
jgi:DNA-binding beta-propeller fold protein YncE